MSFGIEDMIKMGMVRGDDGVWSKPVKAVKKAPPSDLVASKPKRSNREYQICKETAAFMRNTYPDLIWRFDLAGLKLSMAQAGMNKAIQCGRGWCDLFLAEPRGIYSAAFFEIKKEDTRLQKMDGNWISDHIREQAAMIDRLSGNGYYAKFSIGLAKTIEYIQYYMSLPKKY